MADKQRTGDIDSRLRGLPAGDPGLQTEDVCVEENRLCVDSVISGFVVVDAGDRVRIHNRANIGNPFPTTHSTYTVPAGKKFQLYQWNCDSESNTWLVALQIDGVEKDAYRSSGGNDNIRQDITFEFAPIEVLPGQVVSIVFLDGGNNKEATTGFSGVLVDP
jgi:hypothetical protein